MARCVGRCSMEVMMRSAMWIGLWLAGCSGDATDRTGSTDSADTNETGGPTDTDTGELSNEARAALIAKLETSLTRGEDGYLKFCSGCHAANGTGVLNQGPSLVKKLQELTVGESIWVVLEGKGRMPNFDASLSDQEIADITAYTYSAFGPG